MHPDWTLRVPILRPRLAAWLDGAMMAAALAAALLALVWQGVLSLPLPAAAGPLAVVLAVAVAAVPALVTAARTARRRSPIRRRACARHGGRAALHGRVSAIRMDRDGAFHLRLRDGWHPAEWVTAWRGPRWLTLRARLGVPGPNASAMPFGHGTMPAGGVAVPPRCVTFTVWQDALPAPAWRRTCMLTARRLCRTPSRRPVGTP